MGLKKDVGRALSLGLEIAVAVFLGAFIGYEMDIKFNSRPIGLAVGIVLGGTVGMWNAIKMALKEK